MITWGILKNVPDHCHLDQMRHLSPSSRETEELHLHNLVVQTDVHVILNATAANISDDDFVQPVARPVNPVSSSSDKSVKKMQKQLKRLEASHKKLYSEVDQVKVIVAEQRSYFDSQILKLRALLLSKVSDNEVVRASSGRIDGSFFEKCDKVEHITNDRNEVSRDDKIADISIGVGVEGGVVNEMPPNTLNEIELEMTKFDYRFSEAKVNLGAPISYVDEVNVAGEVANDEAVDKNGSKSEQVAKNVDSIVAELSVVADKVKEDVVSVISHVPGAEVEAVTLCNILSRSELSVVEHDNVDDKILEVAREALDNAICDEGMDDLASCFNKSSHDDMKDAGVAASKVVVLRNPSFTTPLPKRQIRFPAFLRSPFLQHFGSSSKKMACNLKVENKVSIFPFDEDIGKLPELVLSAEYYEWLDTRLLANNSVSFYRKKDNEITPPFKLGGKFIGEKIWFHAIEYGNFNLSNSHVDVFMYYLRKKFKYNANSTKMMTTTDTKFQKIILSLYYDIPDCDNIDESKIRSRKDILDVINGSSLPYGTSWSYVESVLIPLWLHEHNHWVIAVLNLVTREFRVCNTFEKDSAKDFYKQTMLPFSKLLPHFLLLTDFYSRSDIDFTANMYSVKGRTDCLTSMYTRLAYSQCTEM
ncbi:hypothetical protein AG4045_025682 [Apium graveolens]|uniref:Ubiquitin-like protease family profile domain-containing protein n=1 Tax=Apium graveolens TaxID=4045 RepID=A0A6L5BC25_APIGR|nr:hypothetical protein AG4045_025682 [Apium graveolens]